MHFDFIWYIVNSGVYQLYRRLTKKLILLENVFEYNKIYLKLYHIKNNSMAPENWYKNLYGLYGSRNVKDEACRINRPHFVHCPSWYYDIENTGRA